MIKKISFVLAMILMIQPVLGSVLIQEVLYNPVGTENGGEAVLLYNPSTNEVDISGWTLTTETSLTDVTIPPTSLVMPGGYFLIADNGFSLEKDESSWPDPDYEEAITMSNSDAGVALMNGSEIVDAVGWGNSSIYEGNPTNGVSEGQSLLRTQDTNNNFADFIASTPVFYSTEEPTNETEASLEIVIDIEVNITNNNPEILSVEILLDENSSKEGVQIKPIAGNVKEFEVLIEAYDADNSSEIESAKVLLNENEFVLTRTESNSTNVFFRGNVSMQYYDEAMNYTMQAVIASDGQDFSGGVEFEYTELAVMTSETRLGFELAAGNYSVKTITVRNLGNTDIQLKVKGTDIVNGVGSMGVDSIEYSVNNFTNSNTLTTSYVETTTLTRGNNLNIDFKVTANEDLKSGRYNGQIRISG